MDAERVQREKNLFYKQNLTEVCMVADSEELVRCSRVEGFNEKMLSCSTKFELNIRDEPEHVTPSRAYLSILRHLYCVARPLLNPSSVHPHSRSTADQYTKMGCIKPISERLHVCQAPS
jgi:hypothetical protein